MDNGVGAKLFSAQTTPVFSSPGYLLFMRKNALVSQQFDASHLTLTSEPKSLPDAPAAVGDMFLAGPAVSASTQGDFTYVSDPAPGTTASWFDQSGRQLNPVEMPAGRYMTVALTSDARRAVFVRWVSPTSNDVWIGVSTWTRRVTDDASSTARTRFSVETATVTCSRAARQHSEHLPEVYDRTR